MSQISASVRLRPIRFGFLVRIPDRARLLDVFATNTCLWGGVFNPIVPVFTNVPRWWDRHGHRFESAKQILNGYLDQFEPDFLVEAEVGLAKNLGFSKSRVIPLNAVLRREGARDREGTGLAVFDLYRELYEKKYQFQLRHSHRIVDVSAQSTDSAAFCACLFGAFPKSKALGYLGRAFREAFAPSSIKLDAPSLLKLYRDGYTSALDVGRAKIEVDYNHHGDATFFVLDARQPRDLIDFWNLRTLQRDVVAVPIQWIDNLSDFCRRSIVKAHRPMPGNLHGVMLRATVMFSRSIPTEDIEAIHKKHLAVDVDGANVIQTWYPSIWRETPRFTVGTTRPTLTALEKTSTIHYSDDKPDVQFDSLHPVFADRYGNSNRWANVVKLTSYSPEGQIATILPTNYRDPGPTPFHVGSESPVPTTEGFVLFPQFQDLPHYWKLTDGTTAISKWLESAGIKTKQSEAGKATQQIVQSLGGFYGVSSIANQDVVKLLNGISRQPVSKSMQQREFINRISDAVKHDIWIRDAAERLVARNAVELGLELRCSKCSSWTWYSLRSLDYSVRCSLCLREFPFPVLDPSRPDRSRWAYRLIGPFALPDFANGGYAAALTIRFFAKTIGSSMEASVAWSAGQELTYSNKDPVEADVILWYQRKMSLGIDHRTDIVFAETKSFGRESSKAKATRRGVSGSDVFKDEDIARMKALAELFPGAILVFSTMKQSAQLTKDEVKRLRALAEWGRQYEKEVRRTRAPVVLLTGTELFAGFSLRTAWEEKGGKHKDFADLGHIDLNHLKTLADLTQQLYLGMPSYFEWMEEKWKARRARKDGAQVKWQAGRQK